MPIIKSCQLPVFAAPMVYAYVMTRCKLMHTTRIMLSLLFMTPCTDENGLAHKQPMSCVCVPVPRL